MSNTFEGGWYKQFMHDMASSVEEDIKNKLHSLGWVRLDEVIDYIDNNIETNWDTGIDYVDSDELVKYLKEKYGVE